MRHGSLTLACFLSALASAQLQTAHSQTVPPAEPTPRTGSFAKTFAEPSEEVCDKLIKATLTIRISEPSTRAPGAHPAVTVASGVSLGQGLIVTFISAPANARIRVTLPEDGQSADARVRVVDHYSGLTLLEIDQRNLAGLALANRNLTVGTTVYTAAGSGIEDPLVSRGMLGGLNRSVGMLLPPVLQCDVRTTASSSGAAIVDQHGQLVGVVVATDSSSQRSGWTYAVPVQHVERLLHSKPAEGVVVLERRRPVLGLNLAPGAQPETVSIERVIAGGPADKAGIKMGDLVTEVDGRKIRIVYQAQSIVLRKQPGEKITFVVRRGDADQSYEVTLGGEGEAPKPQAKLADNQVIGVRQPFVGSPVAVEVPTVQVSPAVNATSSDTETQRLQSELLRLHTELVRRDREAILLKAQLDAWARALQVFQDRLKSSDPVRRDEQTDKLIKELETEIEKLRKQAEK